MSNVDKLKLGQGELRNIAFKELSILGNNIFWVDVVSDGNNLNYAIFVEWSFVLDFFASCEK